MLLIQESVYVCGTNTGFRNLLSREEREHDPDKFPSTSAS